MTEFDIETALEVALNEVAESLGIDVSFPNIEYDPRQGDPYIRPVLVPVTQASVGIGTNTRNRHTGYYQLEVRVPPFETKGPLQNIVDSLAVKFKRGSVISHGGVNVRVLRFRVSSYFEEPDWFIQFIRVEYRADIEN